MRKYYFFLLLAFTLLTTNYLLLTTTYNSGQVKSASIADYQIDVSALIGGQKATIWGYSSPSALVTIEGMGVFNQIYANNNGLFIFENIFSPLSSRETCLTAQDQFGRYSSPTCLPPFPTNRDVNIGPILLSPTLSLNPTSTGEYFVGDEVLLSGQTIPNSRVDLSIFTKDNNSKMATWLHSYMAKFNVIKSAEAFTIPQLDIKSDEEGNFSVSLPSENPKKYRFFAQTYYSDSPSSKSTTLNLTVYPIWMIIIKFLISLFELIRPHIVEITILLQVIVLSIYIIRHFFQPHEIARSRALVLRENFALLEEEKELMIREKYPLL